MTKKEMFNLIATVNADNEEIVAFCAHEISLLDAKRSSKSMTKTQKENIGVMDAIASALASAEKGFTVTELINSDEALAGLTCQKVSALLRKMVADGRVIKTIEGKKAFFTLAA